MCHCSMVSVTLLLTCSLSAINCQLVIWPNGPTLRHALVGSNVTLKISYSGVTEPLVRWLNGSVILATWTIGLSSSPPVIARAYRDVLSIDQFGSLVFRKVPANYSGTYTVQMAKQGDRESSISFTLLLHNIITDVSVVSDSEDVVEGGAPFTLSYSSVQEPALTSTWYFKGVQLVNNTRYLITHKSFIIKRPSRYDTGLYSVVLSNPFSNLTQSKNVTVLYGPDRPVLEVNPTKASFGSGETVSLSCRAEGEPPPSVSWVYEGETLPSSNGTLLLNHVQTRQSGVYTCVMVNSRTTENLKKDVSIAVRGLGVPAIAGIAAGIPCSVLVLLLLIGLIILSYYYCKKNENRNPRYPVSRAKKKMPGERSSSLPTETPPVRRATTV